MDAISTKIIAVLAMHWAADFVFQSHWMATNKSKSIIALSSHIAAYTAAMAAGCFAVFWNLPSPNILAFAAINGALHFTTDFVSSRITSRLWSNGHVHYFFVVIGLDQLAHQVAIVLTANELLTR